MRAALCVLLLLIPVNVAAQDWSQFEKYRAHNEMTGDPKEGEQRVVFMGDSITEGWSLFFPDFFAGKPYLNRGISGQTTSQMLVRFRADVIGLKPAVVHILAGTNDIAENNGPITLEAVAGNIVSMCELARAHNIKVILASILPAFDYPWRPGLKPNEKIPVLNEMLRSYAEEAGIRYLDYFSEMNDGNNGLIEEYTTDGVHLTAAGYEAMSRPAEQAIQEALHSLKE